MNLNIVIASHGSFAEGILSAVEMIAGKFSNLSAYGLDTYHSPQNIYNEVSKQIQEKENDRFIVLCDIKCGSVHNQLVQLCKDERVSLVSGINLSLVLALVLADPEKINAELIKHLVEEAKENMVYLDKKIIYESKMEEDELW